MNFTRWYDKDENLSYVMQTLEQVDEDIKLSVAYDLIQMVVESSSDKDALIEELNADYIPVRRRWYDSYESLHSAVEMLRLVDGDERAELLKEIMHSILYFGSEKIKKKNNPEDGE